MSRQVATAQFHQKSKTLNGKYLLGDEIGKGAYGRVYKGLDLENGDFVAIKQVSLENISAEDLASIMQEIDLLKNLNHKNIVKYLGSIKTRSHLYIVLEYVENGSLASIIKPNKFGAFPESLVAVYIAQVLEGLVYLHEQGVIHRDIKGANILTTKEGLVKLADFGVATKLTEADNNTDSVAGTPYWMAPEVIVMTGVSAASDIWSMGCTVIELLTCVPPYYDLQPMAALYRIVQEDHPPIPEHLSPLITDFLHQCFRKDAKERPDAKTLLQHPWIQNSRRSSYSSIPEKPISPSDVLKTTDEEEINALRAAVDDVSSKSAAGSGSDDDAKRFSPLKSIAEANDQNLTFGRNTPIRISRKLAEQLAGSKDGDDAKKTSNPSETPTASPALVLAENDQTVPRIASPVLASAASTSSDDILNQNADHKIANLKLEGFSDHESRKFSQVGDLSKYSDTPADSMLDDLFNSLGRNASPTLKGTAVNAEQLESSSSRSIFTPVQNGNTNLAATLKAKIEQRREEGEISSASRKTKDMFLPISGSVEEIDAGIADLVTIRTQSVEISRLIGLLKPEESEENIIKTCQRLISIFRDHPDQKAQLIAQHGVMPFMDMLEVKNNRVLHVVMQVINHLAKDNPNFQENACLVGLVPVIMSFTGSECPRDMRLQAAYFVQQLCQTSTSTLQMFIACRGLPVLVNFLEADYAKYREMVHTAIDGMWQVFNLQTPTPRNDFCRIFSKNGVLIRLVNTMHSLNEATRLASTIGTIPGCATETAATSSRSGPLEPSHNLPGQVESFHPRSGQLDVSHIRSGYTGIESLRPQNGISAKNNLSQIETRQSPAPAESSISFPNLFEQVASDSAWSTGQVVKPPLFRVDRENFDLGPPDLSPLDGDQTQPLLISDSSRPAPDQSWLPLDVSQHRVNGQVESAQQHQEQVQLISLLEKDPSSRPVSGQLEYLRLVSGQHESMLPLLHHTSAIRKNNGELDLLMSAFEENGKDTSVLELAQSNLGLKLNTNVSSRNTNQPPGAYPGLCDATASGSGLISQSASGFLSVSGVLNGRPGSATSSGLMSRMVTTLNADVARKYLEKVADLLLEFSRGDTTVKSHMCSLSLLLRLFQMLNKLEPPILLKTLQCIKELSSDPYTLEHLQRAEAMKHLVPFLEWREGPLVFQIHNEVLNALYNLCKINKRRQERAAESGIIPHLMHFIKIGSPLKRFALPLLCDMAHASRYTREQLRANKGIELYLSLLDDEYWAVTALDSLAVCLAFDNEQRKVEQILLKPEAITKLVSFFQSCSEQYFVHILEPFLKIITKSSRINISLATSGLIPLLVARLDHQDAIARLNLLKMIKAIYEHHARPKQLIVEYDLQQKLQRLIEERRDGEHSGGQVLVKQMATSLLKALHFNCVL